MSFIPPRIYLGHLSIQVKEVKFQIGVRSLSNTKQRTDIGMQWPRSYHQICYIYIDRSKVTVSSDVYICTVVYLKFLGVF